MRINAITLVGIALILLGIVALAYQGITYTSREKVIDIGPLHATAETPEDHPAFTSVGRVGACRRDRVGGGRSEEVVVRLGGLSIQLGTVPARYVRTLTTKAIKEEGRKCKKV